MLEKLTSAVKESLTSGKSCFPCHLARCLVSCILCCSGLTKSVGGEDLACGINLPIGSCFWSPQSFEDMRPVVNCPPGWHSMVLVTYLFENCRDDPVLVTVIAKLPQCLSYICSGMHLHFEIATPQCHTLLCPLCWLLALRRPVHYLIKESLELGSKPGELWSTSLY